MATKAALTTLRHVCLAFTCVLVWQVTPTAAAPPRLVVVVSVDQLAYEYLERFRGNFSADGLFERCAQDGAWFSECHHRHAFTITGPGHAVIMTGKYPTATGIIDNEWYDRSLGKTMYCMEDAGYPIVGAEAGKAELKGVSPKNLLVATVGDVLKKATNGKAKIFGVTLKDRAAVLMSGQAANAAYWFDANTGNWVTSRYYRPALPGWLREINDSQVAKCFAGKAWTLLLDKSKYTLHYPDDFPFEGTAEGLDRTFPHALAGEVGTKYFKQLLCTPFGNEMTLLVARSLVENEQLGQDDVPDILCVGLSSNDYVGHNYGPNSLEVEDMTYRTDEQLGAFLRFLDKQVGRDRWVLALTADHGVSPIAEYAATIGLPGIRNPLGHMKTLQDRFEAALVTRFGPPANGKPYLENFDSHQVFLRADGDDAKQKHSDLQAATRDLLLAHPGIAIAFTRDELLAASSTPPRGIAADFATLVPPGSQPFDQFRRAFHRQRSGDVLFALKPYALQGSTPASHGSPWRYDTHVPLLFLGTGIAAGKHPRPVSPAAIAPTLSKLLAIDPPGGNVEAALAEALAP